MFECSDGGDLDVRIRAGGRDPATGVVALAGVSLGCYNPEKDRDEANGRRIVQVFADALG